MKLIIKNIFYIIKIRNFIKNIGEIKQKIEMNFKVKI